MSPRRLRDRCPRNPPLYSDEPVRAFLGGNRLELCRSRGHRRAWNHDRPGRDRRSHLKRRDRQIRQGSGSVYIQRPVNRHITKVLRITRRERLPPHHCCRVASGANGERCAGSPPP
jgi:hypothetical protein